MPHTIADRLERLRAGFFVGRESERERFSAFLHETGTARVLHILGPGGIGKSSLLRRFVQRCGDEDIPTIFVDARELEITPGHFLSSLRTACGLSPEDDVFSYFQAMGRGVLILDTYELLAGIEPWLLEHFFPRLNDEMRVVIGSRQQASSVWRTDPAWRRLCNEIHLRHFTREESRQFLHLHDIPEEHHDTPVHMSYGNPLVLSLMAQILRDNPQADLRAGLPSKIAYDLTERLLDTPPGPGYVTALQLACLLRSISEDTLASIIDETQAPELFSWLAGLSFMRWSNHGLAPHDLIREIVVRDLKTRLPTRYEDLLSQARRHLTDRIMAAGVNSRQRYVEDFFFLLKDTPALQVLFGGHDGDGLYMDESRPEEHPEVLHTIEQQEGATAAASARYWLKQPGTILAMAREASGRWAGFVLFVRLDHRSTPQVHWDPVLRAMGAYIQERGALREGEVALLGRFWMTRDAYQTPGPVQLRLFHYITLQHFVTPGLAFLAAAFAHPDQWPLVFQIRRMADSSLDGTPYGWLGYNWREMSPIQWLETVTGNLEDIPVPPMATGAEEQVFALERTEFDSAVKGALRKWRTPDRLIQSPLIQSRLVLDRSCPDMSPAERTVVLRDLLTRVVDRFPGAVFDDRPRRVLQATYFEPFSKQAVVAQHLQLPFSTYRYHLGQALKRVCDILWQMELGALPPEHQDESAPHQGA